MHFDEKCVKEIGTEMKEKTETPKNAVEYAV